MRKLSLVASFLLLAVLLGPARTSRAESAPGILEQSMSDTLDLWREGRYEQLYEHLAHRGRTSREQFVTKMRETTIRPACCFQKLENFKVLNEKGPNRVTPYFIPATIANLAAGQVSMLYGFKGANFSTTSACASGLHAIGETAYTGLHGAIGKTIRHGPGLARGTGWTGLASRQAKRQ